MYGGELAFSNETKRVFLSASVCVWLACTARPSTRTFYTSWSRSMRLARAAKIDNVYAFVVFLFENFICSVLFLAVESDGLPDSALLAPAKEDALSRAHACMRRHRETKTRRIELRMA